MLRFLSLSLSLGLAIWQYPDKDLNFSTLDQVIPLHGSNRPPKEYKVGLFFMLGTFCYLCCWELRPEKTIWRKNNDRCNGLFGIDTHEPCITPYIKSLFVQHNLLPGPVSSENAPTMYLSLAIYLSLHVTNLMCYHHGPRSHMGDMRYRFFIG